MRSRAIGKWAAGLAALAVFALAPCAKSQEAPTLDPTTIPKYQTPLVIPPAMPRTAQLRDFRGRPIDYYEIAVRQFQQQILPNGFPQTTVWGYGSVNHPDSFNYPAFTVEAQVNRPVRVKWINQLVDKDGNFLPHLLPVDQTLHWANPPGPRDHTGTDPNPYRGPVPMVVHLHGGHSPDDSDGYTEAWFLPKAKNIPDGFFRVGTFYNYFALKALLRFGQRWEPGSATYQYPNDQAATTMWYHDHTLGMTRQNVYAGPAGFYLLRGGARDLPPCVLPGPALSQGAPSAAQSYEIPLAIQDRSFNADGSLFYPASRRFFDGVVGPYRPEGKIPPIWNPEFFGDTIVVNGKTWPTLNVEQRRYRFRTLNGCNTRFLILKLVAGDPTNPTVRSGAAALPFWQIGAEGGFLPQPVRLEELLIAPAERADLIVEFTKFPVGSIIYLINRGPDTPFNGVMDGEANVQTTGQVMRFVVGPRTSTDTSIPPQKLKLPRIPRLGKAVVSRQLSLNEATTTGTLADGTQVEAVVAALLGIVRGGVPIPLHWDSPITERPRLNSTEIWELHNFTVDAHPIHIHEVMFEVIDRTPIGEVPGGPASIPPRPNETGLKDTVITLPGFITRVKAKFDLPGLYVWHCHILEHEDNEMMRPYRVVW